MGIKPEDILPDDKNFAELNGITVRKGTVAASLANAEILESTTATEKEKTEALECIKKLIPALVALGLTKHLHWKNPIIQTMIDEYETQK